MNNVLLLTDFSENSKAAINYGLSLYDDISSSFTLVNILPEGNHSETLYINTSGKNASKEALLHLINEINTNFPFHKIKFETTFRHYRQKNWIREFVKSNNIKIIILSINSAFEISANDAFKYYVDLCKNLNCSILLVPEIKKHIRPDKIVFAVDFKTKISGLSLQPICFLAKKLTSEILLLQISHGKQSIQEAVTGLNVINSFEDIPYSFHMVNESGVGHQIAQFTKTHASILITLVANNLKAFNNMLPVDHFSRILFQFKVPLLLIPE